eukprot:352044-Chlamydomonas_euryale.AAC.6
MPLGDVLIESVELHVEHPCNEIRPVGRLLPRDQVRRAIPPTDGHGILVLLAHVSRAARDGSWQDLMCGPPRLSLCKWPGVARTVHV